MKVKVFQMFIGVLCLSFAVFLFLTFERITHLATDGFAIVRMTHDLPISDEYSPPKLNNQQLSNLKDILSQPFYYFNSGGQSYIFVSEDDNYVLKFFKFHHMRIPPILSVIPLPQMLEGYRNSKVLKKTNVLERTFKSYQIAYNNFREETALVYLHLQETNDLDINLHIVDKIGIHFDLKADEIAFAIQKKGTLAYKKIDDCMTQGNIKDAELAISDIIDLAVLRCKRGLGDTDPDFKTNFGFINGRAAQIDVGRFHLDPNEKKPSTYIPEMNRITQSFRHWLDNTHPDLVPFFDKKLQALVNE